jgi:hypothetical protein
MIQIKPGAKAGRGDTPACCSDVPLLLFYVPLLSENTVANTTWNEQGQRRTLGLR